MEITVKFLASYGIPCGISQFEIEIPANSTIAGLLELLAEKFPDVPINRDETLILINNQICPRNYLLQEGEVATIFHLIAGG